MNETYELVHRAISVYMDDLGGLTTQYVKKLCELSYESKSEVVTEVTLTICTDLDGLKRALLMSYENWAYGSTSYRSSVRRYMCGEDAEDVALSEQRRLQLLLEDAFRLNLDIARQGATGVYTDNVHGEMVGLVRRYVGEVEDTQALLKRKLAESVDNKILYNSVLDLYEQVFSQVLFVTSKLYQCVQALSSEVCAEPNSAAKHRYTVSFNAATGYTEVKCEGTLVKTFQLLGVSVPAMVKILTEFVQSMETSASSQVLSNRSAFK